MGSGEGSLSNFSGNHLYQVLDFFRVFHSYPNPNTDAYEYFDQVFKPLISGSSLSILGSHRVYEDSVIIGIGRENLKVFADFRHSSRFS